MYCQTCAPRDRRNSASPGKAGISVSAVDSHWLPKLRIKGYSSANFEKGKSYHHDRAAVVKTRFTRG
jgi:hypothetical protein